MSANEATGAIPEVTLGWRIQMALDTGGYTNEQMAQELDVHRTTVGRWCHDDGIPPKALYLREIARRCGVNPIWLATGQPPTGPHGTSDLGDSQSRRMANRTEPARVLPLRSAATRAA